jgi:anaerobic magnesium-protoporphyrin IX monomethyl ester cyclase
MRITFLGLGTEQLGISQLSSIIKMQGHQVNVAFSAQLFNDRFNLQFPKIGKHFDDTDNVLKTIYSTNPDVLAFGPLTSTYQWGLGVAQLAKKFNPNIKVVFGGVHVSAVPDLVLKQDCIDYVVIGEGEVAFPQILKSIENSDFETPIVNTRFKSKNGHIVRGKQEGFIQELDDLPFYDKTIWEDYVRIGDMYLTMASRGCPYRCSFCFNNFFAKLPEEKNPGKYVRLRSVDHLIAELKYAKERYNPKIIDFQDDVFGTSKEWLKEFADKYKKDINLPFQILTHPKYMNEEVAELLAKAGCTWVQMGVQSMDDDFKKETLLRYERSDDIEKSLRAMSKHGLKCKLDHMLGLPNEPITAQENALKLYSNNKVSRIQTFWTCFLPGTKMMTEAIESGLLSDKQVENINEGKDFYFFRNTENVKNQHLQNLYHSYEFIFRALPAIPIKFRKYIDVKSVSWVPKGLKGFLNFFTDLIIGFSSINPEFAAYLYHNLFHLKRFFALRILNKEIKATKSKSNGDIIEYFIKYREEVKDRKINSLETQHSSQL